MHFDALSQTLVGEHGSLPLSEQDEITRKLAMLIEGECEGIGPIMAAQKYGDQTGSSPPSIEILNLPPGPGKGRT